MKIKASKARLSATVGVILIALAGCSETSNQSNNLHARTSTKGDLNCLERAMFFEANRSSRDGLVAVGTVVMNRVQSGRYPNSICGVVGQKGQFAPGVMTRDMNSPALPDVREAAMAVLQGERHPQVQKAMFFHTSGYRFPYKNMHYVLNAGGNSFYEKRPKDQVTQPVPPRPIEQARRR